MEKCTVQLDHPTTEALAGRILPAASAENAQLYECSICKFPAFEEPVCTVPCDHLFDRDCLERWLEDKEGAQRTCPLCRTELHPGDGAFRVAGIRDRGALAIMEVDCPQDCEQPHPKRVRYSELSNHIIEQCPATPMLCGSGPCEAVLPRHEMEQHAAECPHALCPCWQCNGLVIRSNLLAHMREDCPERLAKAEPLHDYDIVYARKEDHDMKCTGQTDLVAHLRAENEVLRKGQGALAKQVSELQARVGALGQEMHRTRKSHKHACKRLREETRAELEKQKDQILQKQAAAMQEQQEGFEELRGLNRETQRLLSAALLCRRLEVTSEEMPAVTGEYFLTSEQHNGRSLWANREGGLVYWNPAGSWAIASGEKAMIDGRCLLVSESRTAAANPAAAAEWRYDNDTRFVPAPRTSVTV
eukprot:TRINITY_DN46980_c0_g1_i1.p1 TRINITY_DN46980_c0_g1~~TRINITY_DN46980_c0_g1_i1.p1  ORF type:complete len:447 (+),score=132.45 TRINITY_DN46980_c0_g1_i1:91-1341(+)